MSIDRYDSFIGYLVKDPKGNTLGRITSINREDDKVFAVLDESYEVYLAGCFEVVDMLNSIQPPSWIQLS